MTGLETDQWTDEQETALLKGIVRLKPVGLSAPSHVILQLRITRDRRANRLAQACTSTFAW